MKTWKHWTFAAVIGIFGMIVAFIACDNGSSSGNSDLTVTFDLDGGNIDGNTTSVEIKIKSGGTIANLPDPQKEDNSFSGWFIEKNGIGNEFTATTAVITNLTVYAKWETLVLRTEVIYIDLGEYRGGVATVKVEGKSLAAAEWEGLAQRLQTALQANYNAQTSDAIKDRYSVVLDPNFAKIVVEKTSEYEKWSVSHRFLIYFSFDYIESLSDEELASHQVMRTAVCINMYDAPVPDWFHSGPPSDW